MIDAVVYFLSEEFRKEGLLVPFGTIYRIAENMIAKQNEYADELICCKDCSAYDTVGCAEGFGWCKFCDKGMMDNDFCSHGGRINYVEID